MAKKGQVFQSYTEEFKRKAVETYLTGAGSYQVVAERLVIRNCTQLNGSPRGIYLFLQLPAIPE